MVAVVAVHVKNTSTFYYCYRFEQLFNGKVNSIQNTDIFQYITNVYILLTLIFNVNKNILLHGVHTIITMYNI